MNQSRETSLVCRVGAVLCALPLDHVEETMRPLAVQPVAEGPAYILGLAVVRGTAMPVVDAARLLGGQGHPTRFVLMKAGHRRVALAVDAVLGIRGTATAGFKELPPLFRGAHADAIAAIGALDSELAILLRSTRLVPDELWTKLHHEGPAE